MKNILFVIFIMLFGLPVVKGIPNPKDEIYSQEELVNFFAHDKAIVMLLNNKKSIFYCFGHEGRNWSLIVNDTTDRYLFFNGTTRTSLHDSSIHPFDTTTFVKNNIKTLDWAFDSLEYYSKLMNPCKQNNYSPIYKELFLMDKGHILFQLNNVNAFLGPNDSVFNYQLHKLEYLMFWLSSPSLRQQYLPLPND